MKPEIPKKLTAEWVRQNFPDQVAIADEFRAAFGEVTIVGMQSGDLVIGKFTQDSDYQGCINAGEWLEMSKRHPPTEDPRKDQERPFEQK